MEEMLKALGYDSIETFVNDTIPPSIRLGESEKTEDRLPRLSESELLRRGNEIASMNTVKKSLIGMGYCNTNVPPVIQRNVRARDEMTHDCALNILPYRFLRTQPGTRATRPTSPRLRKVDWSH